MLQVFNKDSTTEIEICQQSNSSVIQRRLGQLQITRNVNYYNKKCFFLATHKNVKPKRNNKRDRKTRRTKNRKKKIAKESRNRKTERTKKSKKNSKRKSRENRNRRTTLNKTINLNN